MPLLLPLNGCSVRPRFNDRYSLFCPFSRDDEELALYPEAFPAHLLVGILVETFQ